MKFRYLPLLFLLALPVLADQFKAKVTDVTDGDTLTVKRVHGGGTVTIRLHGIDAPELKQKGGKEAAELLRAVVHGTAVTITSTDTDKYGRTVAWIRLGKRNVNILLVRSGWAWHYKKYAPNNKALAAAENEAVKANRGLWRYKERIPPWLWRRLPAGGRTGSPAPSKAKTVRPAEQPAKEKVSWLNTNSNVRHNRNCRWYRNTKHGRPCTKNEGRACGICGG